MGAVDQCRTELDNLCVVKFPGEAAERVARSLLDGGPATAADLAERLGCSAVAIRKSLNALQDAGFVVAGDRAPYGPAPTVRRGRPAAVFSLTAAGRSACATGYDELALDALAYVARTQGSQGVREFAAHRARTLVEAAARDAGPVDTVEKLARTLSNAGYAAEIAGSTPNAVQLCQHSCPVSDAATRFPEICEAETQVLSEVLGVHVTRLATIAHGDGVCTAFVPVVAKEGRTS